MSNLTRIKRYNPIRIMVAALLVFFGSQLFAQVETTAPAMADGLRSSGKIYVVVAVLMTVLTGLFIYLITLDRKITRLEKAAKENVN